MIHDVTYRHEPQNINEQQETELSNRLMGLEDRVQNADERLATTRKDLKELSGIGMSPEYLSVFTQRLKIIAQRHSMKPEVVCNKLMDELEQIGDSILRIIPACGHEVMVEKPIEFAKVLGQFFE